MSLIGASTELNNGLKIIRLHWEETRAGWNDPVRRDFEATKWGPLETQVTAVLEAMDRLAPILARAQRECS